MLCAFEGYVYSELQLHSSIKKEANLNTEPRSTRRTNFSGFFSLASTIIHRLRQQRKYRFFFKLHKKKTRHDDQYVSHTLLFLTILNQMPQFQKYWKHLTGSNKIILFNVILIWMKMCNNKNKYLIWNETKMRKIVTLQYIPYVYTFFIIITYLLSLIYKIH